MPQMMPINWFFFLFFFLCIFIIFNIINYYIFNYDNNNKYNKISPMKFYYYSWKW